MRLRLIVAFLALHATADAQTIKGRVFLADGVTSVQGVVVTATHPKGVTAARALTTSAGEYVLHLRAPGTYEVRAIRVGFRPTVITIDVGVAATSVQNIVLSSLPVSLARVEVRDDDDCALTGRDGETFLQLWEQARAALPATELLEQSGALDVRLIRVEGHVDAPASFTDSLFTEIDTSSARELIADRVHGATPAETLLVRGFVRLTADGRSTYDMPNARTLLSDAFVAAHCFSIRSSPDHQDWIGFEFQPRRTVEGIVDIRGVLWLERATAELRRVEFTYTNLPAAEHRVCDLNPFVSITPERMQEVPRFEQPKPRCQTVKNDSANRLGLGGHADFVRLPSGEWLVAQWTLRMPPDAGRIRPMPWRVRHANRMTVRCYHGADCHTLLTMRPRLVTSRAEIIEVKRDGVRLYYSERAAELVSAMKAKRTVMSPQSPAVGKSRPVSP